MDIKVLVSTMNLKSIDECKKLKDDMNISTKALFINQITNNDIEKFEFMNESISILSKKEKGLSKSRNIAIEKSQEDICIIADDDLIYESHYKETIEEAYIKYPEADIICFWVPSKNNKRQTTKQKTKKIGFLTSMKIASYQITFKPNAIKKANVKFDADFGAGSDKYIMGEENIFLFDCLKKNLKIFYVEQKIAEVKQEESTWFKGFNEKYFTSKGACFYRMSKIFSFILIYQFALRKRQLYKENYNVFEAIKIMRKGQKEYKNYIKGKTNE